MRFREQSENWAEKKYFLVNIWAFSFAFIIVKSVIGKKCALSFALIRIFDYFSCYAFYMADKKELLRCKQFLDISERTKLPF